MQYKRCRCVDRESCKHPWWIRFELNGHDYDRSSRTTTRKLAEKIEVKARASILEHQHGFAPPKPTKLSKHIAEYVTYTATKNVTSYKDEAVLDRLVVEIGDKLLTDVRPFDIERWKSARVKDVSKSTVNRELNIIRGCFARAVEWKRLAASPLDDVPPFKVDDQRVRVLSDEELAAVLAIEDPWVALLCRTTLESLARLSEVLSIHKTHIGAGWVEFRKKGGRVSRVPVTPELRAALLSRVHAVSGLVFGEGEAGSVVPQQAATNRVLRALAAAGVPDASHHTMRHTGVTLMLEKGVNPRVIQKLAGWTSLRMLERYGHARDAEAIRAVREVSSHLSAIPDATKSATAAIGAGSDPTG